MHNGRILPQEIAVVWLMPIDAMDYVRQSPTYGLTRQGPPHGTGFRIQDIT